MKIRIASVFVDDQDRAAQFYTDVLGFVKKLDIPVGQFKFLTVASAEDPDGTQILLEPNDNPLASTFQKGVYAAGMPYIVFSADDIQAEFNRLRGLGVRFTQEPTKMEDSGPSVAVFDDTCGNLIQLVQA